jgi:transcription antitermination factor NusG
VPVFPGYLFFNASAELRYQALNTQRIVRTLAVGNEEELVRHLRHIQQVLVSETPFRVTRSLGVGQWVRVVAGPLAGVEGIVAQRRSRLRLILNVDTLGQSVTVEVTEDTLEAIDGPSAGPPEC